MALAALAAVFGKLLGDESENVAAYVSHALRSAPLAEQKKEKGSRVSVPLRSLFVGFAFMEKAPAGRSARFGR